MRPGGAMEGGGNTKGTGLSGLFGAGGAGYSHADLAGVPREYRRAGASGGAGWRGRGRYPLPGSGAAPGGRCLRARGDRAALGHRPGAGWDRASPARRLRGRWAPRGCPDRNGRGFRPSRRAAAAP